MNNLITEIKINFNLLQLKDYNIINGPNPTMELNEFPITVDGELFNYRGVPITSKTRLTELEFKKDVYKKILDLYKVLCNYKKNIFKDKVIEFDEETKNGSNMKSYANMLEKVVENIAGKEIEKGIQSLFSFGATTLSNQLPKDLDDFELISFLIVKYIYSGGTK